MSTHIRQFGINAMLALFILSVPISLPLCFGSARDLVAVVNPVWLVQWKLAAGSGWGAAITLGVFILLWDHRSTWAPAIGKALVWLVRQLWRLLSALWHRGAYRASVVREAQPVRVVSTTVTRRNDFYPPLDLLGPPAKIESRPCPDVAQRVKESLTALGIAGCVVVRHAAGPVVKIVQIRLPEQLRASAVIKAASDLSAMLGTQSVMVKPVVGAPGVLELSLTNTEKIKVPLRALMESTSFRRGHRLPVIIGVDATGNVLVLDLAASATPHLLVAGTTGSGKSWFLRQLLLSLAYLFSPQELGILLIDPKKVEFGLFGDLPHLLRPVVIDSASAKVVLEQLVQEMHKRYEIFHSAKVTNIHDYNQKHPKQRLACIVTVVDELGDLVLSKEGKAVEEALQKLGQLARASGIHLVLATQRPSVDVVTGRIKAVIPARVSLALASHADSRTILDAGGADKLKGNGDLLFMPGGSNLLRGQAAAVPDDLVEAVVGWWQRLAPAQIPGNTAERPTVAPVPVQAAAQGATEAAATPQQLPPLPNSREDQELQWVKDRVLETGSINRRVVQDGLGIRAARANDLVKAIEDLGWLFPFRPPHPRKIKLSMGERKDQLAKLRGVRPDGINLGDATEEEEGAPEERQGTPGPLQTAIGKSPTNPVSLKEQTQRVDHEVAQALALKPKDFAALKQLFVKVDHLINHALDAEDSDAFHVLAANRRCLKAYLEDR